MGSSSEIKAKDRYYYPCLTVRALASVASEPELPAVKRHSDTDFLRTLGSPANVGEVLGNLQV